MSLGLTDWLMVAYIALFSALLSRLTALACGSTWVTSFIARFLNIHRSGVLTALAWLVLHETRRSSRDSNPRPFNHESIPAPCHSCWHSPKMAPKLNCPWYWNETVARASSLLASAVWVLFLVVFNECCRLTDSDARGVVPTVVVSIFPPSYVHYFICLRACVRACVVIINSVLFKSLCVWLFFVCLLVRLIVVVVVCYQLSPTPC